MYCLLLPKAITPDPCWNVLVLLQQPELSSPVLFGMDCFGNANTTKGGLFPDLVVRTAKGVLLECTALMLLTQPQKITRSFLEYNDDCFGVVSTAQGDDPQGVWRFGAWGLRFWA